MDAREKSNRLIGLLGTAQKALVECMDFISDDTFNLIFQLISKKEELAKIESILKDQEKGLIVIPVETPFEECEKIIILKTLEACSGNKTKAADVLKIGRKTIHRKLYDYGLTSSEEIINE
jgi:DNA-binding NtrC family response regulator